jgi:hypothetical protein
MAMERTIKVLNPTAKSRIEEIKMSAPAHDLNGKVIGFMWNHKPNGDILLLRLKEELSRRYKLAGTIWKHWEGGGSGPEASIIEEIAAADMVVVAIGD